MIKYVEYLETDGNCYIEIPPRSDYNETSVVEITVSDPNYNSHYWFSASNWGTGFLMGRHYEALRNNWLGNNAGTYYIFTNNATNSNTEFAKKHTYTLSNDGVSLDGVLNQSWTPTSYSTSEVKSQNLRLFGYNDKQYGQTMALSGLKIYDFKIYNQSNLVYHLRPCLDNNNVPCMHEVVSDTLYHNLGTGTFSYGNLLDSIHVFANNNQGAAENLGNYRLYNMTISGDSEGVKSGVDYVEYLEGDGSSWIDTGIMTNENTQIIAAVQLVTWESYKYWFGSNRVSMGYQATGGNFDGFLQGNYMAQSNVIRNSNDVKLWEIDTSNTVVGVPRPFGKASDNILADITPSVVENSTTTLKLFSSNTNWFKKDTDVKNSCIKGRIYDFKVYIDNSLKIHLKPCLDQEGTPCMYDEVSKQYFYNQGTGEFKYKKKLRDFQPILDSNNIPCLMDKINRKYHYNKNGNLFGSRDNVEYRKLDYLEGDGNSYFDIGSFALTDNSKMEITVANRSWGSVRESLFTTSTSRPFTVFQFGTNSARITHGFGYSFTDTSSFEFKLDTKYTFTMSSSEVTKNGTILATSEGSINETANVYIFRYWNSNPSVHANATSKLYGFKLYDGDEIVFDGIPVLDNDNTPCLYDKISQQFFYNAGSGEFSYEIEELECPPVDYVEYLEADGNSYISTRNIKGVTTDLVIEAKLLTPSNNGYIFGTMGAYTQSRTGLNSTSNTQIQFIFLQRNSGAYTYPYNDNKPHVFKFCKDGGYIDGSFFGSLNAGEANFNINNFADKPFYLFGMYHTTQNKWSMSKNGTRIYYITLTQNGETLADFRPCLDSNGIPCIYDIVSGEYYYNAGTGTFSYGNPIHTPIPYLESNGTQYIDTEVVPTDNTDIDMVCRAVEGNVFALDYWYENSSTHHYTPKFACSELNNVLINNSEHSIVVDYYNSDGVWKWQSSLASGSTTDLSSHSYVAVRFVGSNTINYVNDYVFVLGNKLSSKPQNSIINLQDCMYFGNIMNNLSLQGTYKCNEVDTTVSPNLNISQGATLTLGSDNLAYLTEEEIEQAINNGWTLN